MAPLLRFTRTFDTTIEIGDVKIPIHVARLAKEQLEAVDEGWERLVVPPRGPNASSGSAPLDVAQAASVAAALTRITNWNASVAAERYTFFETMITNYITLDAGFIEDEGQPVGDVLRDLISAVLTENHLVELMRKNLNSPRGSAPGSELSIPARGGDGPGSTAASVTSSTTAGVADATDRSNAPDDARSSSGGPDDPTRVH
jgi:hypothetical protein